MLKSSVIFLEKMYARYLKFEQKERKLNFQVKQLTHSDLAKNGALHTDVESFTKVAAMIFVFHV